MKKVFANPTCATISICEEGPQVTYTCPIAQIPEISNLEISNIVGCKLSQLTPAERQQSREIALREIRHSRAM